MPLTISKLKMWKDPGYTRGCLEVPPVGSKKLPAADYTFTGMGNTLRPRKESTLTALELPLSFTQVFDMSYLYIEASDGIASISLFGWIDSIEQTASSGAAVMIRWNVDWWRSYSDKAVFGRGRITRCADGTYKRPYHVEPRKWVVESYERLSMNNENYPYTVVIVYNIIDRKSKDVSIGGVDAVAQWNETQIQYVFWNCSLTAGEDTHTEQGQTFSNPSLRDIFTGNIDELLGINPDTITGIFILPFLGWPTTGNIIIGNQALGPNHCRFAYIKPNFASSTFGGNLSKTYESSDLKKTIIVDPNGSIVGTLPWGYSVNQFGGYGDVGTVSAVTRYLFGKSGESSSIVARAVEGLCVDIPALTCPVNSNAWSSYVYSGRREYEIKSKEAQRTTKAFEGLISGGVLGSISGQKAGGILGGILGGVISAGFSEMQDDQLQQITDQYYSNQASNILIGGGGEGFTYGSAVKDWYIVQLVADDVSQDEYDDTIALNGYEVDMTVDDVSSFITAGGALSISDMVITGSIPPEAKRSIKDKFVNGCYIVENNPSGVTP